MAGMSAAVRRGTRLATQILIAALAIAAMVLFSCALHQSDASSSTTTRTGYESVTPTTWH